MAFKRKEIIGKKSVGSRLKAERKKRGISLEEAEEATKVRSKYLEAIETGRWQEFPSRIYVLGYVRRYGEYLGFNPDKIVSEFKEEFGENDFGLRLKGEKKFIDHIVITPRLIAGVLAAIIVGGIVSYVAISANNLSKPPTIEITSPKELTTNQKEIVIEGKTSKTAIVEINNQIIPVDDQGNFSQKTALMEGVNQFEIKAKNRLGKEQAKTLEILYNPNK